MIDFHTFATSNGQRVAILLEECALPYRVHWIDLMKGEQHTPGFLKLNPAGAIPVIVDPEGPDGKPLTLSQSGAIVIYLAEKTGRAIFIEAWGEFYLRNHLGIHQIHSRRASCSVLKDEIGRDGAIRFYFGNDATAEMLLFKYCGQL